MTKTIALIAGSTRKVRLGPSIAAYVQHTIAPRFPSLTFETIDLADHPLPIYDESAMPNSHPADDPTPHYEHDHTRRWSAVVRRYDAFIFVTPQYNWSVPAGLKNALDFLFHEWSGKPAGVVSYGGRGGGKAAAHLRDILNGLRMRVLDASAGLTTSGKSLPYVQEHGTLREEDTERWREEGAEEQIAALGRELAEELAK